MSAAFRLDPAREQSISGGEELDEERRQTGGPSIKHRIQARFDVVARRPRPRQPDDPAIRRREQQHFGAVEALPLPAPRRVASVDALRGFTMFWIIGADGAAKALAEMLSGKGTIASTAGNIIGGQFEHAEWEGLRFYDLIFPLFIFVTGVAIVFSLTRLVEQESKFTAHWRVLRRSLLLFALGLVYYGSVSESWPDIRLLGVLNRIALCYLFTSLLFLNLRLPGLIVVFVAILAGYWALMTFVPVSGIEVGSYAKDANLANWIDAQYLPGRKWNGAWDPEGLLSTLPAIGTCLLGVFAGLLLKEPSLQPHQKTLWLIGAGAAMIALGVLWGLQFPIVKNIWTSSYVLVCGGLSALLLGVFHQVIDAWERRSWATIFIWIGASAITLYLINGIVGFKPLATQLIGGDVGSFVDSHLTPGAGSFLAHAVGLLLAVALAGFLYRRKIFLRV
jgi:predicted acyltransferase